MLPVKVGSLFQVLRLTPKMLLSYEFKLLDISHLLLNIVWSLHIKVGILLSHDMGDMGRALQKISILVHTNSGK